MLKNKRSICASLLVVAVLAGCGGGGGDDVPDAPQSKAEGAYQGSIVSGSGNQNFQLLILENDEFWGLYGTKYQDTFYVSGLLQGQGNSSNNKFTASGVKDFWVGGSSVAGSVNADYVAASTISGSFSTPEGSASFTGSGIPVADYDYNTPATLSSITGTWSLGAPDEATVDVNIATNGNVSGSSSGCSFTGTLRPRASGKNVFDMQLQFGAAPCALPGQTAQGVALLSNLPQSTQKQLIVVGVDAQKTAGLVFFGIR